MKRGLKCTLGSAFVLVAAVALALGFSPPMNIGTENGEWRFWGGDEKSTRYSPLDQINESNVAKLQVAWRWKAANYGPEPDFIYRATPLKVGDKLFTVAGSRRAVVAIDPATGETLWMYRMKPTLRWEESSRQSYGKGVVHAKVDGRDVIYTIDPGYYLVALDAETGQPLPYFGINGVVDLMLGLGPYPVDPERGVLDYGTITASSPPIVVNGVIVVGNSHEQGYQPPSPQEIPGHVRGYDAKTGKHLWTFHVLPQPGEPGHDTWEGDSWKYTGNISSWAPLSADSERGLVFIPTDTPTGDFYGGHRHGKNLYGTSLLALDVKTGKLKWYFQMVHHDIWNMDNPDAPKVVEVTMSDGRRVPMVAQATKQGWLYVFHEETGQPIWPVEERPVPSSDVPGEKTWPTQPFPTKPAPFEMQGITEDQLIDFTPELRAEALEIARQFRWAPHPFNPPSLVNHPSGSRGSVVMPGGNGGANIPGGAAVDPESGVVYVATVRQPSLYSLVEGSKRNVVGRYKGAKAGPSTMNYVQGPGGLRGPRGLPLFKPPYGSIVAIDLKTGEHLWRIPNGETPQTIKNHPALANLNIPSTGQNSHANLLVTKSLLFYGEGRQGEPWFHALDKKTGREIAKIPLPAQTNTAPMTYMHEGKQYIVMAIAGDEFQAELVALRLPD
jgi:quinoprotein glucose dehydrogenase